jgi:hypothetical protein
MGNLRLNRLVGFDRQSLLVCGFAITGNRYRPKDKNEKSYPCS